MLRKAIETRSLNAASSPFHAVREISSACSSSQSPNERLVWRQNGYSGTSNSSARSAILLNEAEPVSTLPEKWDTNSLEDELRKHTSEIRNKTLRRKTPRRLVKRQEARGSNVVDSLQWGLKRGVFLQKEQQIFLASKYQRWQNAKQMFNVLTSDIGRQPDSAEWAAACNMSEHELSMALSDGPKAADLILASVEGLLRKTCKQYLKPMWESEDMFLEAQTIWLEAVRTFDPSKGAALNSFAVMFLRQRLSLRMNAISDTMSRSPLQVKEEGTLLRVKSEFQDSHGREPSVEELSRLIRKSVLRTKFLSNGVRSFVSFDSELSRRDGKSEDNNTVGETLEEESNLGEGHDSNLLPKLRRDLAQEFEVALNAVIRDPRDKEMLRLYYNLDDPTGPHLSYKEVGKYVGMSYENVRLRLKKSIRLLREHAVNASQLGDYHVAEILDY